MAQAINTMKEMLEMQRQLLEKYRKIEMLPQYPLDLNTRSSQKLIKVFVGRLTEELVEAYKELYYVNECMGVNERSKAMERCKKYNYEMADVTHFMLEILIYCGIDNELLDAIIYNFLNNESGMVSLYEPDDTMGTLLRLGSFYNYSNGLMTYQRDSFNVFEGNDNSPEFSGGLRISPPMLMVHSQLLWVIVCESNLLLHELNNKEWKKKVEEVGMVIFYEKILFLVIAWGTYLNFAGFTNQGIYDIYCLKNKINHERIKDGY